MSRIYSLLTQNYQAAIWREATPMSKSLKELLDGVAELAREELFESRVLPRDMLKLSDAITDIFKAHCVLLGFEADLKEYLAQGILEKSKQNRLLEEKVMFSMLHLLDRLELDGSIRHDSDDNFQLLTINTNDEMVSTVCRQVANVIVNRFKNIESKKEIKEKVRLLENETEAPWMESEKEHVWIEREYFVFPATPNWVTLEFGAVNFTGADEFEFRNKLFSMAMGVLCTSQGPISGTRLRFFKFLVKADPVS
ncbi:hypothetical protein Poli38472_007101 [Pythium oligandrum]|uniref:Uncharacterized protein n=1 Tax=Pythium oligandrum TaxID=41045 RepID=A0A8K1C941_PYTOL|nr:hypothetical protein Poli38472_007101 [Pythium oligandrum]|eukprot:TMW58956.1 hypothetical protein Poli38472_007101 [Pythium oligandrum]